MSQATPNAPTVVTSAANTRQQVPLRDYLNARVAPFLKKAITESLDAEAEFPLQWLGECLIHQSMLFEGNPDRTKIRERFLYKFDDPKPQESLRADAVARTTQAASIDRGVPMQRQSEVSMGEDDITASGQAPAVQSQETALPRATSISEPPAVNGVQEDGTVGASHEARDGDTDMGGTL